MVTGEGPRFQLGQGILNGHEEAEDEGFGTQWTDPEEVPDYGEFEEIGDEGEATALNAMEELDAESSDPLSVGEAIQLQLAANAAFGKAKGKGGKGPKGKGKGKLVRSHLTLEQRRSKLQELKKRSKCLRCGGHGHWAGDPDCKFPGPKGKGDKPAGSAFVVYDSDASSDHEICLQAGQAPEGVAMVVSNSRSSRSGKPGLHKGECVGFCACSTEPT